MKIELADIKSVISWMDKNSSDVQMDVKIDNNELTVRCKDKYQADIEIKVFPPGGRKPRIIKEDALNEKG